MDSPPVFMFLTCIVFIRDVRLRAVVVLRNSEAGLLEEIRSNICKLATPSTQRDAESTAFICANRDTIL